MATNHEFESKALYQHVNSITEEESKVYNGNITKLDLQCAHKLYPILVMLAKQQTTATYGELCEIAHKNYPEWQRIDSIIPVRCGRILGVIGQFLEDQQLPFIQALILNTNRNDCGDGIQRVMNTKIAREEVFKFNWDEISSQFEDFILIEIEKKEKTKAPTPVMSETDAQKIVLEHYKKVKKAVPKKITDYKHQLFDSVRFGMSVVDAYENILQKHFSKK